MTFRHQHAPDPRAEYARRALSWGQTQQRALQERLADFGRTVYMRTVMQEAKRHGIEMTPARIQSLVDRYAAHMQNRVSDIAQAHAASIVRTHNVLIRAAATRLAEEDPAINRYAFARRLARVEDAIGQWKWRQVNETERASFYQAGFEDFYLRNTDLASLFDFGGSLICEVCQEIAQSNPYSLQEMIEVDDPPHIGCLDVWTPAA